MIVNLITPDNFDRKFKELRGFMFGEHKLPTEQGYDPEVDTLTDNQMNEENVQNIVETIFKKAQKENQYSTFYGDLCEKIICLEL